MSYKGNCNYSFSQAKKHESTSSTAETIPEKMARPEKVEKDIKSGSQYDFNRILGLKNPRIVQP